MKTRKPLVVGNWKMNGDVVANERLFTALRSSVERSLTAQVDVVVCPPYPYLGQAGVWLGDTDIGWGAQDLAATDNGAFTGEVSASMLVDLGCRWAIIGHSERRTLLGETDAIVAAKLDRALAAGLAPIVCVGESLEEREAGRTEAVLAAQIDAIAPVLAAAGSEGGAARAVLAYEPVWAIGTGRTATPTQAQDAHAFIRLQLFAGGVRHAADLRLLYGGSVKPSNAASLFAMGDVDGGLIGGAALVADEFVSILKAAAAA